MHIHTRNLFRQVTNNIDRYMKETDGQTLETQTMEADGDLYWLTDCPIWSMDCGYTDKTYRCT